MHLFWRNTGEIPASFLKLVTNMIPTLFHLALDGTNGPGINLNIPPNALLLADMGYPDDGLLFMPIQVGQCSCLRLP